MASTVSSFETQHQEMIHDTQPDHYGKRLATCSSDKTIKIFDFESKQLISNLAGHSGPVFQVAWAHPKFGSIIASCGYDHKVIVWREGSAGMWEIAYEYTEHTSSVNSVAWGPHEHGLTLACASSDNHISVLSFKDGAWTVKRFNAHATGANSVSWAPFSGTHNTRLVSGGCDNIVKIWELKQETDSWEEARSLKFHADWVRDVAWAPNIGVANDTIASCSQDKTCVIWTSADGGEWVPTALPKFNKPVWRVAWSITGNILAVSSGDNRVTLWKEDGPSKWRIVSAVAEGLVTDPATLS